MRPFFRPILLLWIASLASAQSPDNLPEALSRQGRFAESAAVWRSVLAKDPSSVRANTGLVLTLLKLDDVKTAEENSTRALAILPQSASVPAVRGQGFFCAGLPPPPER